VKSGIWPRSWILEDSIQECPQTEWATSGANVSRRTVGEKLVAVKVLRGGRSNRKVSSTYISPLLLKLQL
jgi:hypothetical protein